MSRTSENAMKRPVLYEYIDYRIYLADMFLFHKKQSSHFSYRFFSRKAGFSSPNFLKLVMDRQRNLTNASIAKVAKGFGLKKDERDFFENLVFMNQAATHEEKNHYYRKMMAMKAYRNIHTIEKAGYEYFSKWYHPVIREIVAYHTGELSAEQVAEMLEPAISHKEAKAAFELLEGLGLIGRDGRGAWRRKHGDITTGPEIRSLVIANFHREMIKLAAESLERFPARERDISALSLSIKREHMDEFKERMVAFRKELLELAATDEHPDRVIQINIQMFPLTR